MIRGAFRIALLATIALCRPAGAQGGQDKSGFTSGFEDGTLQGYVLPDGATVRNWAPRGGDAIVANSTELAHGGTHSLKTTGRRRPYQGPSINVLGKMNKGFRYLVTMWARLVQDPAFPSAPLRVSSEARTLRGPRHYFVGQHSGTIGQVTMNFNVVNPRAVDWIAEQALEFG